MPDETIWGGQGPKPVEGIQYVDEAGNPEEAPVGTEAPVLQETPAQGATSSSREEETPPEPAFLYHLNKFGPGAHGVYFPDGQPVGVWLHEEHGDWDSQRVHRELLALGMEEPHASDYARRRLIRDTEMAEAMKHPAMAAATAQDAKREEELTPLRKAFIEAQKRKTA